MLAGHISEHFFEIDPVSKVHRFFFLRKICVTVLTGLASS